MKDLLSAISAVLSLLSGLGSVLLSRHFSSTTTTTKKTDFFFFFNVFIAFHFAAQRFIWSLVQFSVLLDT